MNLDYEEVARRAQKYTEKVPVMILGSGASIPHGLPSMKDLADELMEKMKDHPDDSWNPIKKQLDEGIDLESALSSNVLLSKETLQHVVKHTWSFVEAKDREFQASLIEGVSSLPLVELISHFVMTSRRILNVITPNYDRLVEYAADAAHVRVTTGFALTNGLTSWFCPAEFEQAPPNSGLVRLFKLHGSLNWFRRATDNRVTAFSGACPSGSIPMIVTPGTRKYEAVSEDPLRTLMTKADETLLAGNCFLCLGYGFNDQHIQVKLTERIVERRVPIVLLARTLTDNAHCFLQSVKHNYMAIEADETYQHSKVYTNDNPDKPSVVENTSLWTIDNFRRMLQGERV